MTAIKARAPVLGGNFGVWGGLFSTFDCAVKGIRKKEDPYNASRSPSDGWRIEVSESRFWSVRLEGNFADGAATIVIAGFFTGGALAVRGGVKAARNSAIMCACFLAVIEGVGIGFQRMMAENTRLDVSVFTFALLLSTSAMEQECTHWGPFGSAANGSFVTGSSTSTTSVVRRKHKFRNGGMIFPLLPLLHTLF
jgi:hypothetical protein